MQRRATLSTLAAAICTLVLWSAAGCSARREVHTVMGDVNPFGWLSERVITFENRDTATLCDLALTLRCGSDLETGPLTLEIEFTAPDSTRFVERRTFALPHPVKPAATAAVVTLPYRRNVRFNRTGTYTIALKPSHTVRGIEAAGFTFENQR